MGFVVRFGVEKKVGNVVLKENGIRLLDVEEHGLTDVANVLDLLIGLVIGLVYF